MNDIELITSELWMRINNIHFYIYYYMLTGRCESSLQLFYSCSDCTRANANTDDDCEKIWTDSIAFKTTYVRLW